MDRAEQMREADPRVDILRDEYYGDDPLDEYEMRDVLRVLSKLDAIRAIPAVTPALVAEAAKMLADAIDRMTDAEYLDAAYELDKALQTHDRGKAAAALRRIAEGEA